MAIVASGQLTLVDVNDSKQLQLYISSSQPKTQIYNPNTGAYTPHWPTNKPALTPQLFVAGTSTDVIADATSIKWYVGGNEITVANQGTDYTLEGTAPKFTKLTINTNVLTSVNSKNYVCEVVYTDTDTNFDVTAKADIEFVKVSSGSAGTNALSTYLSNEAHTVPTDAAGANGNYTGSGTEIHLYEGTTELTYDAVGTSNGTWKVVATATGITAGAISDSGLFATAAVASNMTTDTATISYAITGKRADGTAISITKVQTFSKSKGGAVPTAYWMTVSSNVIQKNIAGTTLPATLTITGFSQTGTNAPASTAAFKFVTDTSTDGTTFTNNVASPTGTLASTTFNTNFANLKAVRFRLYRSADTPSTTNFIDEQIVMVVSDGATGANAVFGIMTTPDGNLIRNASGTLKVRMDIYEGGVAKTATATKWYIQDPTATTASGGDADGGNGWRLINATWNGGITNYATPSQEITVPASVIVGVESFKCIATYNSVKYTDVITVMDITDPIQVVVAGVNTFKNGVGTTSLTAKLYRAGVEIDGGAGPYTYTYTWTLWDSEGVKNGTWNTTGSKTGKTITVDSADVNVRGNILCEVSQ